MTELIKKQELLIETMRCMVSVLDDAIKDAETMLEALEAMEDDGK